MTTAVLVLRTFYQARADFEAAWNVFLSKRTKADFQASCDQLEWTAGKYWRCGFVNIGGGYVLQSSAHNLSMRMLCRTLDATSTP
jgi:hypothetical protein